jgi:hypothetical protein
VRAFLESVKALSELHDFILVPWPGKRGIEHGLQQIRRINTDLFHPDQEITAWAICGS